MVKKVTNNNLLSTQHSALELEKRHQQEDHDRLMERHSVLMQEMATKGKLELLHSPVKVHFVKSQFLRSLLPIHHFEIY